MHSTDMSAGIRVPPGVQPGDQPGADGLVGHYHGGGRGRLDGQPGGGQLSTGAGVLPAAQHRATSDLPERRLQPDVRPVLAEVLRFLRAGDEHNLAMAERSQVVDGHTQRRVEVDVDVGQALDVTRAANQCEGDVHRPQYLDPGVVELDVHRQDPVNQALTDQLGELGGVVVTGHSTRW